VQSRLDEGVEAVFEGAAPGYRLEEATGAEAAEKTATDAEAVVERRGEVERLLEKVRMELSGLPVYVGVEEGYVKRTAPRTRGSSRNTPRRVGGWALDSTGGGEVGRAAGGAEGRLDIC